MKWLVGGLGVISACIMVLPAQAAILLSGSGWQSDVAPRPGVPTTGSIWTFSVVTNSVLSVVDRAIPGDVYTLTGGVVGVTGFSARSASDVQASGPFAPFWTNILYSKLALQIAPGAYSFSISGDGKGGTPSSLGLRLDASAVPEPSSWALLVTAFGVVGIMLRRHRSRRLCRVG